MKKIITIILILYSITGFAVNWQKVAENETGNYFVDFESVKKMKGLFIILIWLILLSLITETHQQ